MAEVKDKLNVVDFYNYINDNISIEKGGTASGDLEPYFYDGITVNPALELKNILLDVVKNSEDNQLELFGEDKGVILKKKIGSSSINVLIPSYLTGNSVYGRQVILNISFVANEMKSKFHVMFCMGESFGHEIEIDFFPNDEDKQKYYMLFHYCDGFCEFRSDGIDNQKLISFRFEDFTASLRNAIQSNDFTAIANFEFARISNKVSRGI